ncbi:MAG: WD40 repeat domain-containing protein [Muribaculaceae bacterium]|nr:WD40 repeat domain-containing protein [Muribaculaceae bacterium]MDE6134571.1 WD40 repeat domain-containing protein [Muribaculaceae bacterium]
MKPTLRKLLYSALATFTLAMTPAAAEAQAKELVKTFNRFKHTPDKVVNAGPAVFAVNGNSLESLYGKELHSVGKYIIDADANPFCTNFFLVANDKKNNKAVIFRNNSNGEEIYQVNRKKLGNPWQVAYSSDGLRIYLASDSGLIALNAPDRAVLDRISTELRQPDMLILSDNGYYAALAQGSVLAVYNLEQKTLRKEWDFEVKINDMTFNDNTTELAVATADGVVSIFDTRNFLIKKSIDDLGEALACSYNFDGKYLAVAVNPERIEVINLLNIADREVIDVPEGSMNTARFIPDSSNKTLLLFTSANAVNIRQMGHLTPYFGRLINDEANERLNEWLKMMPGETMEEYRARVTDESREHQRRLFEEEISTRLAPDMLSMASVSLGNYDRANGMLQVDFSNMPSIFLPVPETDLSAFTGADGLEFRKSTYGVLPDDSFELIYAEVFNKDNGKTYVYNNIDRVPLNFMSDADNVVSLDLILQQQMEEQRLEDMRKQVLEQARQQNVISDHTNITVDSRIEPDYDADGKKILNYHVKFSYEVDPGFTATEDFAPGKYHAEASGAASSMLKLVSEALEGDFAQYVNDGKKLAVTISGTADATPIVNRHVYDGAFGDINEVPIYQNGKLVPMTIHPNDQISQNEQLAFLRAYSVKEFLNKNIDALSKMNQTYRYDINVAEGKGSEFRRITLEFNFVDAF